MEVQKNGEIVITKMPMVGVREKPSLQTRINMTMKPFDVKPVDLTNATKTKNRIRQYLRYCGDNDVEPSPIALCSWLGVSRVKMQEWRSGKFGSTIGEKYVQDALMLLEERWYQGLMENKQMVGAFAFIAKNWYGYKDTQDVVVTPANPLGDEPNRAELEKRIKADVVIDVEPSDIKEVEPKVEPKGD